MNSFDRKFLAILSGGPGVVAISLGIYVYSSVTNECGSGYFVHPYGNIGMWLMSLGLFGVLSALLSLDSSIRRRKKSGVNTGVTPNLDGKSTFSIAMIGLLVFNLTVIVYLTPAMLSGPIQFYYGCPVVQLSIIGASIDITSSSATFGISNSGTGDVVLAFISVTGGSYLNQKGSMFTAPSSSGYPISTICAVTSGQATVPKNSSCTFAASFAGGSGAFVAGTTYSFKAVDTKGNAFPYTTTA